MIFLGPSESCKLQKIKNIFLIHLNNYMYVMNIEFLNLSVLKRSGKSFDKKSKAHKTKQDNLVSPQFTGVCRLAQ